MCFPLIIFSESCVANLIVIEPAAAVGVNICLRDPARAGMTAALASLAILAAGTGARSAASSFALLTLAAFRGM